MVRSLDHFAPFLQRTQSTGKTVWLRVCGTDLIRDLTKAFILQTGATLLARPSHPAPNALEILKRQSLGSFVCAPVRLDECTSADPCRVTTRPAGPARQWLEAEATKRLLFDANDPPRLVRHPWSRYFNWYDTEHYHSGIDYVTPQQAHRGLRERIVEERRVKMTSQRRRRREENQRQESGVQKTNNNETLTACLVA